MTIIIFILILALLILIHELGHFLSAKWTGMRVDEFGLGFPPKIFSFRRGETKYSVNLIPFGGYVKIFGEDPTEETLSGPDSERSFSRKPKRSQALVLAAGVFFNFVLAWVLISTGYMIGLPTAIGEEEIASANDPKLTITFVEKESRAEDAGLLTGDVILFMESKGDSIQELSAEKARDFILNNKSEKIILLYSREGNTIKTEVKSTEIEEETIGIGIATIATTKLPPHLAIIEGAEQVYAITSGMTKIIGSMIIGAIKGEASLSSITGPVGIVNLVGNASKLGWLYLLSFTAFISVNLAVINLIPFPALDGGRLLFLLIEYLKGSPINMKIANTLNTIGFVLLLTFMIAVTYNDVVRLFFS